VRLIAGVDAGGDSNHGLKIGLTADGDSVAEEVSFLCLLNGKVRLLGTMLLNEARTAL
jgi:hypothetical protein